MPGTSKAFTLCNALVRLADPIDNLVDVSKTGNKIELELGNKTVPFSTFADGDWPQSMQCGKEAKIKFTGIGSTDVQGLREMVEQWYFYGDGDRTFQFDSPDGMPGNVRYEIDVRLGNFKFSGEAGKADPVMYEVEFVPNGPMRRQPLFYSL